MQKTQESRTAARLGAVMIVRNEEKNLGDILSDIRDVVDEIVVVDTGSTDRTIEIATSHGARIGNFAWCDDFSAARNASIELATADYLLWLDADDRIYAEAQVELGKFKASLDPSGKTSYFLRVHNLAADHADTVSHQLRIFPNRDGIRFSGRLHEQVLPSLSEIEGMKFNHVNITVHHTGYHTEADVEEKGRRNLAIQLRELEEGNDSPRQYFYIAMSYHAARDYTQCLAYIDQARQRSTTENWYKYSFNLATECHLRLDHVEQALSQARDGAALFPVSGTMQYNLGVVCQKAGLYDDAIAALKKAADLGIEVDAFPTPPNIRATLPWYLGQALERSGRKAEAMAAYQNSVRNNPDWVPALKSLGFTLVSASRVEDAIATLEKALTLAGPSDIQLILGLGKLYRYLDRNADAHRIYLDALPHCQENPQVLAGLVLTSVAVDDVERMLLSLEALMHRCGMETERDIESVEELAVLSAEVGRCMLEMGDTASAATMADAAHMLCGTCWNAHLLASDVSRSDGNTELALTFLQKGLSDGAPAGEVERRMALFKV